MTTSDSTQACPKCGAAVPTDVPQGVCPSCVLACAATAAADPPPSATATGEIPSLERVAAAFPAQEVIEMIGRGGVDRSGLFHYMARFPAAQRTTTIRAQAATDPWEALGSDTTGPHGRRFCADPLDARPAGTR